MVATIGDVANGAGVSRSLVSRVLNGDASVRVRPETRERVLRVAAELAYTPNHNARALRLSRSGAIALIVPDVNSAIFADMLNGVEDAADEADYVVLLGRGERLEPGGRRLHRLVEEQRVDGYLLQYRDDRTATPIESLISRDAPVVVINSQHRDDVSSVILDDPAAARVAVEHLVALGHEHIAMISGVSGTPTAARREEGFFDAMKAAERSVPDGWVIRAGYRPESGESALLQLWSAPHRPTAIVVANVNAAFGALRAARSLGIDIPGRLSIVALHDVWTAEHTWRPLTCVRMPLYELGKEAVQALMNRLSGNSPIEVVITQPEPRLIRRESTGPATSNLSGVG
jgi:LacI family transcriptional regulator